MYSHQWYLQPIMIAQWENESISLSVLSMVRALFPAVAEYLRDFSLADHSLLTSWQKLGQSPLDGSTQAVDIGEACLRRTVVGHRPSFLTATVRQGLKKSMAR